MVLPREDTIYMVPIPLQKLGGDSSLCPQLPRELLNALERQGEGLKPKEEDTEMVNCANKGEEPREIRIGVSFLSELKLELIALLKEFSETFSWSYQDIPGLDTDMVVHQILIKPKCKPIKQALRRMKP